MNWLVDLLIDWLTDRLRVRDDLRKKIPNNMQVDTYFVILSSLQWF